MTEVSELRTGEAKEQPDAHMVDMRFGLGDEGVDYHALVGLQETFKSFREAYEEELGVVSVGAHINPLEQELRVVAHVDGSQDDVGQVVGHVTQMVESCGVTGQGETQLTILPRAS